MTLVEAMVLFGSAAFAAALGVLLQRYLSKASPVVFAKSCELSSALLSRVDYLSMPDDVADKFSHFRWTLAEESEFIPNETTIIPVGFAQEQLYHLREFVPRLDATIRSLENAKGEAEDSDIETRKQAVSEILSHTLVLRSLQGKTRRQTFSVLQAPPQIDVDQPPIFPWAVDDAGGVGKGTLGTYTIHTGSMRHNFPFRWQDEKERMKLVSYLLASCHQQQVPQLLEELRQELVDDRQVATDLQSWLTSNIDVNSTLIISVSVSNMGKRPILMSGAATLVVPIPGKPAIEIACQSETFSDNTEEEHATRRTVKVLKRISQSLDAPIPIRARVPSERLLVSGGEATSMTFRSLKTFDEVPNGTQLLHLFRSREIDAHLEIGFQTDSARPKTVKSKKFTFGSSIPT